MDYKKTLEEILYASIGAKENALENLSDRIIQAAQMLSESLLAERKILLCGEGTGSLDAQRFASQLVNGFEMERSALPALVLGAGLPITPSTTDDNTDADIFIKQLETLAESGDLLIVIGNDLSTSRLNKTIRFALSKEIAVLMISGKIGRQDKEGTNKEDKLLDAIEDGKCLQLPVAGGKIARVQETHLLIINILCYLVEKEIFSG
ncbi:MAG: SIS domain-containing protein [Gammaproteobacteria bacterium]|nr:SIS domain-containing protein [Gammaproteobacteria bacterium]